MDKVLTSLGRSVLLDATVPTDSEDKNLVDMVEQANRFYRLTHGTRVEGEPTPIVVVLTDFFSDVSQTPHPRVGECRRWMAT